MSVRIKLDMSHNNMETRRGIVAMLKSNIPFELEILSSIENEDEDTVRLAGLVGADPSTLADHSNKFKGGVLVETCGSEPAFAEYREYRFMEPQRIIDWVESLNDPIDCESDIEPSKDVLPRLRRRE